MRKIQRIWNKEKLQKLYCDKGKPLRQLAKELGVSKSTIRYVMVKLNIKRRNRSEALVGWHLSEGAKAKLSAIQKGKTQSEETKLKHSKAMKRIWADPEVRRRRIGDILKAVCKKPNRVERKLINLINKSGLPFKYVGNGEVIIGDRCPDFINTNGKKQLIELFGTYWHDIFDVARRKDHFRQYGFDTLVIWEDELCNKQKVIHKIRQFARK